MPEKKTVTQKKYTDAVALHKAGIPLSGPELASATGRDEADFQGLMVAKHSPDLEALSKGRIRRNLRMAGMDDVEEGPIGLALLVEDIRALFKRFRK